MGILSELTVRITADTSNLMTGVSSVSGALQGLVGYVGGLSPVTAIIAGLGVAAIGFGAASTTAAADFQTSAAKIQAYAGLSAKATDQMKQSILDMSTQVGLKPKELSDALYPIVSSGYSASESLNILKLSAETAAASGAKTSVVADALTTSLKSMHQPASQAGLYMDYINKICSLGKGTIPEYSSVIGKLSLSAGSAGVDFKTMGAALATLTTHGFPSVAQASTALGNLYTQIGPKVDNVAAHAKKLGLAFDENAFKSMSFADKMDYLNKVTGGNQGQMLKLLNGNTLALKSYNALEGSTKDFKSNLEQLGHAQGSTASAFAVASGTYNFSMQKLGAALEVLKINVGNALLPMLTGLVNAITPLVSGFSNITSAASPLSPILANVAGMFRVMGSNWVDLAGQAGPAVKAFQGFGQLIGHLLPGFVSIFLLALSQVNLILVSLASAILPMVAPALNILGQILKGMQVYWQQIVDVVGAQLVPALQNLISAVAPLIQAFLQWIATSGIIPKMFQALGVTITFVISVISFLINVIASIITWLSHCSVVIAIVKFAFTFLAAVILTTFNIIIGIINGIIGLPARIQSGWSAITSWWSGLWNTILSAVRVAWSAVQSTVSSACQFVINIIQNFIAGFINYFVSGFNTVVGWFQWLYAHNYYFQALCDSIRNVVSAVLSWLSSAWSASVSFLAGLWIGAAALASSIWSSISSAVSNAVNIAHNAIVTGFNAAISFLQGVLNNALGFVRDLWNNIAGIFTSAYGTYVAPGLASVSSGITGFFSNLASIAISWGTNLIQGFIDGINNMAGAAGNAASNVVANVKSMLGFHSPSEDGPGRDSDTWAPNLMRMFTGGITGAIPDVRNAAMGVASQLNYMNGSGSTNYSYAGRSQAMSMAAGSGSGEQHIHVYIGNEQIEHYVSNRQMKNVRLQGVRR